MGKKKIKHKIRNRIKRSFLLKLIIGTFGFAIAFMWVRALSSLLETKVTDLTVVIVTTILLIILGWLGLKTSKK